MLEVRDLQTSYGRSQVLFGISLDVPASQVVSLLGRNGMGKTTTVRSIMGITRPRSGTISFESRTLNGLPSYRIAQAGLGLVPEGRQVFPNLTVRENLVATARKGPGRRNGSTSFSRTWKRAREITATSSPAASSRCSPSAAH